MPLQTRNLATTITVLLILSISSPTRAFEVQRHWEMSRQILNDDLQVPFLAQQFILNGVLDSDLVDWRLGYCEPSFWPPCAPFSQPPTQDVLNVYSKHHFDNNQIAASVAFVNDSVSLARNTLLEWDRNPSIVNTYLAAYGLFRFGQALHAIQDFYAHSNYVESNNGQWSNISSVPLWDGFLPPQFQTGSFLVEPPPGGYTHEELNKDSPTSPSGSLFFYSPFARLGTQYQAASGQFYGTDWQATYYSGLAPRHTHVAFQALVGGGAVFGAAQLPVANKSERIPGTDIPTILSNISLNPQFAAAANELAGLLSDLDFNNGFTYPDSLIDRATGLPLPYVTGGFEVEEATPLQFRLVEGEQASECREISFRSTSSVVEVIDLVASPSWLSLDRGSVSIAPGARVAIEFCLTSNADVLTAGTYNDSCVVLNQRTGIERTIPVVLAVSRCSPILSSSISALNVAVAKGASQSYLVPVLNSARTLCSNLEFSVSLNSNIPALTDIVGGSARLSFGDNRYRGNVYRADRRTTLTGAEAYLNFTGVRDLDFVVLEAAAAEGAFTEVFRRTVLITGDGEKFYSSGKIAVPLVAGRYYLIAVGWMGGNVTYFWDTTQPPAATSFGAPISGFTSNAYPMGSVATVGTLPANYYQRLTVQDLWLSASPPSGSVSPGATTEVQVTADATDLAEGLYEAELQIRTNDPNNATKTIPVTLNVTPGNHPPIAGNDDVLTMEDLPLQLPLGALFVNDSDQDGNQLSLTGVTQPGHGSVQVAPGGAVLYAPAENFHGSDFFDYFVCDNGLPVLCDTARVNVIVSPVNDPPRAYDDTIVTLPGVPKAILVTDLLANDVDVDGDQLTVTGLLTTGTVGNAQLAAGQVTYDPAQGFSGSDAFRYIVQDGAGARDTALVAVLVGQNCRDDDHDGVNACDGDCDDSDPQVHSGAPEICDGKDNDCNGRVDDAPFACGATGDTLVTELFATVPQAYALAFSHGGAYGQYMYVVSGRRDIYRVDPAGRATLFGHTRPDARANAAALFFDDSPQQRYGGYLFAVLDNGPGSGPTSGGVDRILPDGTSQIVVQGGNLSTPLLGTWDGLIDDTGRFGFEMLLTDFEADDNHAGSTIFRVAPTTSTVTALGSGGLRGAMGMDLDRLGKFGGDLVVANPRPVTNDPWWNGADNQVYRVAPDGTRTVLIPDRSYGVPYDVAVDALGRFGGGLFVNYGGSFVALFNESGIEVARGVPGATTSGLGQDRWGAFNNDLFAIVAGCRGTEIRRVKFGHRGCLDADRDGWTVCDHDPDDSDPLVHPGALEVCDGKDNDGNGRVDDTPFRCGQLSGCDSLGTEVFSSAVPGAKAIAFSPGGAYGNFMYVLSGSHDIYRVDPAGHATLFGHTRLDVRAEAVDILFDESPQGKYCGYLYVVLDNSGNPGTTSGGIDRILPDGTSEIFLQGASTSPLLIGTWGGVIDNLGRFGFDLLVTDFEADENGSSSTLLRVTPAGGFTALGAGGIRGAMGIDLDRLGQFGGDLLVANPVVPIPDPWWAGADNQVYRVSPGGVRTPVIPNRGLGVPYDVVVDAIGTAGGGAFVVHGGNLVVLYNGSGSEVARLTLPASSVVGLRQDRYGHFGYNMFCALPDLGEIRKIVCTDEPILEHLPPVVQDDSFSTDEDQVLTVSSAQLLANDGDPDGGAISVISVRPVALTRGDVTLQAGRVTFSPQSNFNGTTLFEYTVQDDEGEGGSGQVRVEVRPVNDAPVARPDTLQTGWNLPIVVATRVLLANDLDVDGDSLRLVSVQVTPSTHGTVEVLVDSVRYVPERNFSGGASFTYVVRDVSNARATGEVAVTVRECRATDRNPPVLVTKGDIVLWPPNHRYELIDVDRCIGSVIDACDQRVGTQDVRVVSVSSDEPEDARGGGDGNTLKDIVISCPNIVQVRAERQGDGNGRVYTIIYEVADAAGNIATAACHVNVPHDQAGSAAVADLNGGYSVTSYCARSLANPSAQMDGNVDRLVPQLSQLAGSWVRVSFVVADPGPVRLEIFDVSGRLIQQFESPDAEGDWQFTWDGRDRQGRVAVTGLYFFRLRGPDLAWLGKSVWIH